MDLNQLHNDFKGMLKVKIKKLFLKEFVNLN